VSYYDYYQPEAYMPNSDTYIEKEAMINEEIDRMRHEATTALLSRNDVIIVASVSCIYGLGVPANYLESAIHLEIGKAIVRADLIRQLVKIQFVRTPGELKRGTFRVRGDVFEIMPASETAVYRIELAEQKVSEIALVDHLTKKITEKLDEIVIFPPKHFISEEPQVERAIKDIKLEMKDRLKYFKSKGLYLEAERLERRVKYDMEMLRTIGYCHGIENYSRHLVGKMAGEPPDTLLSYFPKDKDGNPDFLLVMDESHIGFPQVRGMYAGDQARKKTLADYGFRLPSALDNRPLKIEEFLDRIGQTVFTSATPGDWEIKHSKTLVEQVIRPTGLVDPPIEIRPVFDKKTNRSQIDDVIEEAAKTIKKGERIIINTLTKKQAEDLNNFLVQKGIKSNYLHSDVKTIARNEILLDFRRGKYDILIGVNLLREGLDLPEVSKVAILDADREGFLRSESALIQTMGRAARNVSGEVILYADNLTGSIKRAVSEVNRRRAIQLAYNKKHGIEAVSVKKDIEEFFGFEC
jgi:excinuclease ABC subunit B